MLQEQNMGLSLSLYLYKQGTKKSTTNLTMITTQHLLFHDGALSPDLTIQLKTMIFLYLFLEHIGWEFE